MHYTPSPFAHVSSQMLFRTSDLSLEKVECLAGFVGLDKDSIPLNIMQHDFISFIGDPVYAIIGKSDPYLEENITFDTLFSLGVEHEFKEGDYIITNEFTLDELLVIEDDYFFDNDVGDVESWKVLVYQDHQFVGCNNLLSLDKDNYVSYNQVFGIN